MVSCYMVQQLPLKIFATNQTSSAVLALVCGILHTGGDQAMAAQQMPFQALVCEEPELALLAIQRWAILDHLWMNFHLMNLLEVISQRVKVFDVAVAYFADDKVALDPILSSLSTRSWKTFI